MTHSFFAAVSDVILQIHCYNKALSIGIER